MIHRVTYQGQPALIGLTWRRATRRAVAQPLIVEWSDRVAFVEDDNLAGFASAVSIAATQIPLQDRLATILTLIQDDSAEFYAYHILVDGICAQEKEAVFANRQAFFTAVHTILAEGQIDSVAGAAPLLDGLETAINTIPLTAVPTDADIAIACAPANKAASPLVLVAGIMAIMGLVAAWYWVPPIISDWMRRSAPAAQNTPQVITLYLRDKLEFTRSCRAAFIDNWPQAPGWTLQAEGCADIGMQDPELAGYAQKTPVAYRKFNLQSGYNPILARRVAEAVYDSDDYDVQITGNSLFATRPISAPRLKVEAEPEKLSSAALLRLIEDMFIGKLNTISSQGVNKIIVRTSEDFNTAVSIPNRSQSLGFLYFHRKGSTTYLGLTQRPVFQHIGGGNG